VDDCQTYQGSAGLDRQPGIEPGPPLEMDNFILASASPRRKQLLEGLDLQFLVRPIDADESLDQGQQEHPAAYIARRKAKIAHMLYPDSWILACDTVVEIPETEPVYLGKASSRDEARSMLLSLSDREHVVRTGHSLVSPGGDIYEMMPTTRVRFRNLNPRLLEWYLDTNEWTDKAGSYGIQEKGALLIESLSGDYFNVVGLSILAVDGLFQKAGLQLLDFSKQDRP